MTRESPEIPDTTQRRRLAAILAADVAGYTRAMAADEAATLGDLRALLTDVVRPTVANRDGRIFKEMGDGILAEFPSAVGAAQCASEIQSILSESDTSLRLRIGLHLGDVLVEGDDLFGDGVNLAARFQAEAEPGGIVASAAFRQQVEGRAGLLFTELGSRNLKGFDEPVALFAVGGTEGACHTGTLKRSLAKPGRRLVLVGLGAAVLVIAAAWLGVATLTSNPPRADGSPAVAVLPFENLSADADQIFFAEGLAEDLITDLSKLNAIRVISRTSSFAIDRRLAAAEVAERLNAGYIVSGSVRRSGERLRISASLIDPHEDTPLWAERFDGSHSDVFSFQDEITRQIVEALQVQLTQAERSAVTSRGTQNPDAYDAYLRGLRLMSARRRLATERNQAAQVAFKEAIRLDPRYAQAYAGLAWAKWLYVESVNVFNWEEDSRQAFELAKESIALDDNALAHRVLARRHFALMTYWVTTTRETDLAVAELETAQRLQPSDPDVLADLALVLNFAGRPAESLELIQNAMELNPNHPEWYFAPSGISLMFTGRHERAVEDLTRWTQSQSSWNVPHLFRAAALGLVGRTPEANLSLARFEHLSNTLGPVQFERLDRAETEGVDALDEPLTIRTTFYAVKRKWPMQPREEEILLRGLAAAGMTDIPN